MISCNSYNTDDSGAPGPVSLFRDVLLFSSFGLRPCAVSTRSELPALCVLVRRTTGLIACLVILLILPSLYSTLFPNIQTIKHPLKEILILPILISQALSLLLCHINSSIQLHIEDFFHLDLIRLIVVSNTVTPPIFFSCPRKEKRLFFYNSNNILSAPRVSIVIWYLFLLFPNRMILTLDQGCSELHCRCPFDLLQKIRNKYIYSK